MSASRRGSILIVSLWFIALLAVICVAVANRAAMEVRLVQQHLLAAQAGAWAEAGVRYALQLLQADAAQEEHVDWLGDDWALAPDGMTAEASDPTQGRLVLARDGVPFQWEVMVRITDEERRFPLHAATADNLARFGLPADAARAMLDAVDPPDPAEDDVAAQPPYHAKNAPLRTLEELWEIPTLQALPDETRRALVSDSTIYGTARVNLNTASARVLAAMGLDPSLAEAVAAFRGDPATGSELAYFVQEGGALTTTPRLFDALQNVETAATLQQFFQEQGILEASVFRVTAHAVRSDQAAQAGVTAVLDRTKSPKDGMVVAWWEE